ncbi:unnamed protein product [Rhizoctonia solani]|uniref:Zn(2)-C6 fungal-type domain-containing protein n=1 Tax=Rhizoctonia solani TaxID=456999 RepID=A0A8H3BCF5_9AGAM|nr:unnamed protein product [Rhizoctonia solani]
MNTERLPTLDSLRAVFTSTIIIDRTYSQPYDHSSVHYWVLHLKKKCDEHKPHCLRCTKGGFECEGYPTFDGRIRRVTFDSPKNPGPGRPSSRTKPSEASTSSTSVISFKDEPESAAPSESLEGSLDLIKTSSLGNITSLVDSNISILGGGAPHEDSPESGDWLDASQPITSGLNEHLNAVHPNPTEPSLRLSPSSVSSLSSPLSFWHHSSIASSSTDTDPSVILTPGQASLLGSTFSIGHLQDQSSKLIESGWSDLPSSPLYGPAWSSWAFIDDADSLPDDGGDPEGIRSIICRSPTPDPNTQSNALPFVLQSCEYLHHLWVNGWAQLSQDARWVTFVAFEPLKVADMIRDGVIMQFASSPDVRTRTCLIANVIGKLSKSPDLDQQGISIVSMLWSDAHRNIECFRTKGPASDREMDMQNALRVLDSMIELILIQRYSRHLYTVIALMQATAPVFRRACPDLPGKLVNLPNILTSSELNLRHFAAADVIISVTTARPMFFKYDVKCTPEAFAQLVKGDYGLQWLHGVPDQFIVLLAWINVLREDHGDNVDPKYVAEIERQVRGSKIKPGPSPNPVFLILRLAVQECWRQTVYVYLYVVLCRAHADDPRVVRAVRAFVNIVDGVKPGRNPDSFLLIPTMVVGAFAYHGRDRDVLRRRITSLRECSNPSTSGYDCVEILEDIWRRTHVEDRPAVWSDLRISCYKIACI